MTREYSKLIALGGDKHMRAGPRTRRHNKQPGQWSVWLTSRDLRRKRRRARITERDLLAHVVRYGWNESTWNLFNRARRIARNG